MPTPLTSTPKKEGPNAGFGLLLLIFVLVSGLVVGYFVGRASVTPVEIDFNGAPALPSDEDRLSVLETEGFTFTGVIQEIQGDELTVHSRLDAPEAPLPLDIRRILITETTEFIRQIETTASTAELREGEPPITDIEELPATRSDLTVHARVIVISTRDVSAELSFEADRVIILPGTFSPPETPSDGTGVEPDQPTENTAPPGPDPLIIEP